MNIKVNILYCSRSVTFAAIPAFSLQEIIQQIIEGGYAKEKMLTDPGVYSPDKNQLYHSFELSKKLEQLFPMINIQGPPIELIILRKEEFDQYDQGMKSQPQLEEDCFPPDSTNNLVAKAQPSVDDLFPQSTQVLLPQTQTISNVGQNFKLHIKLTEGLQKKEYQMEANENFTPNDVKDQIFARLGYNDRSIVDLNLYFNDLLLVGLKSNKTLSQLSIPSGSLFIVKARWTGGGDQ